MNYVEIKQFMESFGFPCAYQSFPIGTVMTFPYVVFYYPSRNDDSADNINYGKILNLTIVLYTKNKDIDAENTVENALESAGMFYEKSEAYVDDERMFQIVYESEVALTSLESET